MPYPNFYSPSVQSLFSHHVSRPWVCQTDAAYLLAMMWNRLDAEVLEPFLCEDIIYESQHVMAALSGKYTVMEYLRGKTETLRAASVESKLYAEIGVDRNGPCVLMGQGHPEKLKAAMLVQVDDGIITRIDACGVTPDPLSIRATGIIPR